MPRQQIEKQRSYNEILLLTRVKTADASTTSSRFSFSRLVFFDLNNLNGYCGYIESQDHGS